MTEPIERVIVRGQQKLDFHDVLIPVEIEINDDSILNILKNIKIFVMYVVMYSLHKLIHYYKLTPVGLLFPSSVTNDTKKIFVKCRELNDAKKSLINGKIYSLLGIINLEKINSWENIKGKSL